MISSPPLVIEGLQKRFVSHGREIHALKGVSITLERGETLGIVGESGSGKSTLGRIAVGLERPTAGQLSINGVRVDALPAARRAQAFQPCQMIFQDPYSSLNPRLPVGRQIGEGLFARGEHDWRAIDTIVFDLLDRVGLSRDHASRYPHEFSGGQRQRIAIARAIAPNPEIIVADEPVSALDVTVQAQILDLLAELKKGRDLSYLFISHDMAVIARLCDRIAVMHNGRIVEYGPVTSVIETPHHPYTQVLLEAVPRFGRRRTGQKPATVTFPRHDDDDRFITVAHEHRVLEFKGHT